VPRSELETQKLHAGARRYFGFTRLMPGQAEAIACTMRGEDVLAVLPTGGGKSLCYQLPALLEGQGVTLVISPLVALMKDQLDKLPPRVGELATNLHHLLSGDELRGRMRDIQDGKYRLVYAAPERLRQLPFLHALSRCGVRRMVVDEVHCVSLWGHDFRPDYLYIPQARRALGGPVLMGMTATAPTHVRREVVERLGPMRTVTAPFLRPNLRLEVSEVARADDKLDTLDRLCRSEAGSGIVYAGTRRRCEVLAERLRCQGISALHYHAGIEDRASVQEQFMDGRVRVVVATVAFGMGIDKPDVRFVLHFVPPTSLEEYYQEAGRAGRDGEPARCVLLYAPSDARLLRSRASHSALPLSFVEKVRASIAGRLGQNTLGRVAIEDICRDVRAEDTDVKVAVHFLEEAGVLRRRPDVPRSIVLRLRRAMRGKETEAQPWLRIAALQPGRRAEWDPLRLASAAGVRPEELEKRILNCQDDGLITYRSSMRDPYLELLPAGPESLRTLEKLLNAYGEVREQRASDIIRYATSKRCRHQHIVSHLGGEVVKGCQSCDNCLPVSRSAQVVRVTRDDDLYLRLKEWRLAKAKEQRLPAFCIAHDTVLRSIAASRPQTEADLRTIKGIGPAKCKAYGAELLQLIHEERSRRYH
jgi:ATP-dependent DNA helicase RecQ